MEAMVLPAKLAALRICIAGWDQASARRFAPGLQNRLQSFVRRRPPANILAACISRVVIGDFSIRAQGFGGIFVGCPV